MHLFFSTATIFDLRLSIVLTFSLAAYSVCCIFGEQFLDVVRNDVSNFHHLLPQL